MPSDPILQCICDELVSNYGAHTILLYGSQADGSATQDSDYDVAAFAPIPTTIRDVRTASGVYLDAFVYPEGTLLAASQDLLRLRGAKVAMQRGQQATQFLHELECLFSRGPERLPQDELQARQAWALKMTARTQRGDAEGNYRRVWLLYALLEDYFQLRHLWYEGPKKALRWLQAHDKCAHQAFVTALEPNAGHESILALANLVVHTGDN